MFRMVSKVRAFFRRRADSEVEKELSVSLLEDDTDFKTTQGAVASASGDYGLTDECIKYGTEITDTVLLSSEQNVTPVVEEDETSQELKATNVDDFCDNLHSEQSEPHSRDSFGCLNSLMGGADSINSTGYFSVHIDCKDFEPYPGDNVEVVFSVQQETQRRKVLSVRPRRHKHVHEVCITSVHGRNGVIDDAIFFTLDSLILPDGYVPQIHDVVNAVVVESVHAGYIWRAVSITPVATE
ncbi:cancer/testis antigen 55 [Oryctolagus cuniculus]|uniref:Cancer/testis antigen 55 n=1 Tax=Oryctolagus cuniculus TaxID=9986 RepID=U3KND3_RABIT|nr:cancer/testis antigen 55 [Oryctolagus cuniculus]XP_051689365.1 cancer/testis antigen 55 [Oryctolagus cuniculus]